MADHKPKAPSEPDDKPRIEPAGSGDNASPGNHQDEMSERLDEALEETFPSSDPVSVKITK